ncbi:MAG: VCBS repeat-containing protein [Myxococcota bacterium]
MGVLLLAQACEGCGTGGGDDAGGTGRVDAAVTSLDAAVRDDAGGQEDGSVTQADAAVAGDAAVTTRDAAILADASTGTDAGGISDDAGRSDGGTQVHDAGSADAARGMDAGETDSGVPAGDAGPLFLPLPAETVTITGRVVDDAVAGATVVCVSVPGGTAAGGTATTGASGEFAISAALNSAVIVAAGGGSFTGLDGTEHDQGSVSADALSAGPFAAHTLTALALVSSADEILNVTPWSTIGGVRDAVMLGYSGAMVAAGGGNFFSAGPGLLGADLLGGTGVVDAITLGSIIDAAAAGGVDPPATTEVTSTSFHTSQLLAEFGVAPITDLTAPLSIDPFDLTDATQATDIQSNPASPRVKLGLLNAALAQAALTLGVSHPLDLVDALKLDFMDGVLDGKVGSVPIPLPNNITLPPNLTTTILAQAARDFLTGGYNTSGLGIADFTEMIAALEREDFVSADISPPVVGGPLLEAPTSGCVNIGFTLRQPGNRRVDVLVEFDEGNGFQRATQANAEPGATAMGAGIHGVRRLATGFTPAEHVFLWNATNDITATDVVTVNIRITAFLEGRASPSVATGSLQFDPALPACPTAFGQLISLGGSFADVRAGDFNGDGKLDVAVADSALSKLRVFLGHGSGQFTASELTAQLGPVALDVGDVNHDGVDDVAVASLGLNGKVQLFLGGADGLTPGGVADTCQGTSDVALGDLDGDLHRDVAVTCSTANQVALFRGDGSGAVSLALRVPTLAAPSSIAAGDFNNDGAAEFVVAHDDANTVLFLTVPSSQVVKQEALSNNAHNRVEVFDLDQDGRPELLLTDYAPSSGNGSVLDIQRYNRDLTLDWGITRTLTEDAPLVTAGDFTGDDYTDYLLVGFQSSDLEVGIGDPATPLIFSLSTQSSPVDRCAGIVAADFNSDGMLDLVCAQVNGYLLSAQGFGGGVFAWE